jgi:putative oxygen-independent coproporphyrinogen III oxidase
VPSTLPDGEPVPADGSLPDGALRTVGARGFGIYLHVPFCTTRCGYCDFNTYTATELAGGARREDYPATVIAEIELAAKVLGGSPPAVDTIFIGGGTPTLLGSDALARMVDAVESAFGLAVDVEITTEANPETVDLRSLRQLRRAGFTRISLGMQSAVPHVLAALDRQHTPGRPEQAVVEAREAGFDHVNLDLIYGAPGESLADWRSSLDAVVGAGVDHVSAYALIVEEGTRLHRQVSRGEVTTVDDDGLADRYLLADAVLEAAGFGWYEVSNWASTVDGRCRHNELYWRSGDWWGIGPGAHSHVGGTRWWNVKHPAAYASRLAEGRSPAHSRELLSAEDKRVEEILLRLRMVQGLPLDVLTAAGRSAAERAIVSGLLERVGDNLVLTVRGRLLADAVVRDLVD